ncbi:MAG: IcmQ [uncultured bacterium]|nr:MAG: IcmQ [uncultured bacterium]
MDNLTVGLTAEHKGQALKKKLLACLKEEHSKFSEIAETIFRKDKLAESDKTALLQSIVEAVDHVLEAGDWDSSLFLRNVAKPLKIIKAEAENELNQHSNNTSAISQFSASIADNEIEVYISLFQSDGYNIDKWAMQLRSLDRYIVGRPVYQNETDVIKRIRLKAGTANEAYVVVAVLKSEIQENALREASQDSHGHALLLLKETAMKKGRIIFFVHQGMRYRFIDGKLMTQG